MLLEDFKTARIELGTPEGQPIRERLKLGDADELIRIWCLGELQEKGEDGQRPVLISTDDVDRMGDIVEPRGMDIANFRKNPVVLWAHDYALPPIGSAESIKRMEHGILARVRWASTEFAQQIKLLYDEGHLRAWSVGFIPRAWEPIESKDEDGQPRQTGRRYTKAELLEFSAVPVPANPNALSLALAKGLPISKDLKELLLPKAATTVTIDKDTVLEDLPAWKEWFRRDASGYRESFEAWLSTDDGQRFCGYEPKADDERPSTVVQTLIFSKEVFETAESAKAWAKEHDFKSDKVDETEDSWRLRQRDQGDFEEGSFRTISLAEGVKAVVGHLKKAAPCAECASLREQLSAMERRASAAEGDWQASKQELAEAKAKIEELENAKDTTVRIDVEAIRRDLKSSGISVAGQDLTREELRALVQEAADAAIRRLTGVVSR